MNQPPEGPFQVKAPPRSVGSGAGGWNRTLQNSARLFIMVVIVFLLLNLVIVLYENWFQASRRTYVSRSRSDMRTMATAIETYRLDHGAYPVHEIVRERSADGAFEFPAAWPPTTTFRTVGLHSLTTPIAYVTSFLPDEFSASRRPFRYQSRGESWLLGSFGPDRDEATGGDLPWGGEVPLPAAGDDLTTASLLYAPWTYDPTNGTGSSGDLWRMKQ